MKNTELLDIQTNASETDKQRSSEIIEKTEIPNSPFIKVKMEDKCFIAMGMNRLTNYLNEDECREITAKIAYIDWELMTSIIAVITQQIINNNNNN